MNMVIDEEEQNDYDWEEEDKEDKDVENTAEAVEQILDSMTGRIVTEDGEVTINTQSLSTRWRCRSLYIFTSMSLQ